MALYVILFFLSLFLIFLVLVVIKKMFFHWKEEHKIESMAAPPLVSRPAVSVIIYKDACVLRKRVYADEIALFDALSKSEIVSTLGEALLNTEIK